MEGARGEHEPPQSGHLAIGIALAAPFVAAAVLGGWWNAHSFARANGWLAQGRDYLAASYAAQEVSRSALLALGMGLLWALVAALFRARRSSLAGLFAFACALQAAWLVLVLEAPESWRVVRVRHALALPNLLWRVVRFDSSKGIAGLELSWMAWTSAGLLVAGATAALALGARELGKGSERWSGPGRVWRGAGVFFALVAAAGWLGALARERFLRPDLSAAAFRSVIVLTWDSTRADHLSCYGYERETTPEVDRFAADAVLFERAYANHNWTRPSYMSVLTGRPAWEVDLRHVEYEHLLLGEALKDAGFATRAFVQNPNLDFSFRMDQGIDRYHQFTESERPAVIAEWVRASIDELAWRPFYLFVHIEQPHWPYLEDGAFVAGRYDPDHPLVTPGRIEELLAFHEVEKWDAEGPDAAGRLQYLLDLYDGDLFDADAAVGEILRHLRAKGLYDQSLIVFHSDHGDEFFDRGNFGHAHRNVHPDVTRVPLVVRFPASFGVAPRRSDVPVQNLDLYPTVLDVLGLPSVAGLGGTSLLGLVRDPAPDRVLLSTFDGLIAVRNRDYALVRDFKRGDGPRLFDISLDPSERVEVRDPESVPAFRELDAVAEWWGVECWPDAPDDLPGAPRDTSPELEERLRKLGYVDR